MPAKKVIITALVTLFGVGGIITGAVLLRQRQSLQSKAAVQGGRAEMRFQPNSGSFDVGDTILLGVYFNTDGVPISTVKSVVTYPYTGTSPEVTVSDIEINPLFSSSGSWTCETPGVAQNAGKVTVSMNCATVSASGYSTSTDTLFGSFNLNIQRTPASSPFIVEFDPAQSVILQLSNGADILNTPSSSGVFSVSGAPVVSPTTSVTPTTTVGVTSTVSPTVTPTGTVKLTPTPTKVATQPAELMDSGFSVPTLMALGAGLLLVFGALAVAL